MIRVEKPLSHAIRNDQEGDEALDMERNMQNTLLQNDRVAEHKDRTAWKILL